MMNTTLEAIKKWLKTNKYELLGFVVGMVVVLIVAGIYRISWELPEEETLPVIKVPATPQPANAASKIPTPSRAVGKTTPVPQKPMRARPVLKKLDGPPEALRRAREQQRNSGTP